MANIKKNVVAEALGEKASFRVGSEVFMQTPLILCPCGFENKDAQVYELSPQEDMAQLIANVRNFSADDTVKLSADTIEKVKFLNSK